MSDFSLSNKTVRRSGTVAVKEAAMKIKADFKKTLVEDLSGKKVIIVHFDGSSLAQFHDQLKSVKKRLAVIATSPDLATDQVLGVPITSSNSGKDQQEVIVKLLEEWEIVPFILGLAFDTTSDNTGRLRGAVF